VSRALVDTSIFIARETGRDLDTARIADELTVSIITIGELRQGVLSATTVSIRDARLVALNVAQSWDPLPVDDAVAAAWARLHLLLRDAGRRMPANDSWIAATAVAAGVPILTQDDDFDAVSGLSDLEVIKV
jgi:predicted nucleic acid-binding protein